jgi:hypothetical protein
MSKRKTMSEGPDPLTVLTVIAAVLSAPTNRFGKPEYYTEDARQARDELRLLAQQLGVTRSETVLHQAAQVARAVIDRAVLSNAKKAVRS